MMLVATVRPNTIKFLEDMPIEIEYIAAAMVRDFALIVLVKRSSRIIGRRGRVI